MDSTLQQLKGSILIAQESTSGRMHHMARQELYTGRYTGPLEQVALIMAVTRADVAAVAAEFLAPGRFSLAALGPVTGEALGEKDWPLDGTAR